MAAARDTSAQDDKHRRGGLIDIEFVAQLGVLVSARLYPRVIQATGTLEQISELEAIGWLPAGEAKTLRDTMERLRERRMMASLVAHRAASEIDTAATAGIFSERIGAIDGGRS